MESSKKDSLTEWNKRREYSRMTGMLTVLENEQKRKKKEDSIDWKDPDDRALIYFLAVVIGLGIWAVFFFEPSNKMHKEIKPTIKNERHN